MISLQPGNEAEAVMDEFQATLYRTSHGDPAAIVNRELASLGWAVPGRAPSVVSTVILNHFNLCGPHSECGSRKF